MEEDHLIYEYDSIYDNISSENKKKTNIKDEQIKPKYINSIFAASERRKAEQSIIKERIEIKKREKEEGEIGEDKPKFITRAYENQLSLNYKRNKLMKLKESYDEKNSVMNKEIGMSGFYSSLLTKNKLYSRVESEIKVNDKYEKTSLKNHTTINSINHIDISKDNLLYNTNQSSVTTESNTSNSIKINKFGETVNQNTIEIKDSNKTEEYKKKYLERKRNRDQL